MNLQRWEVTVMGRFLAACCLALVLVGCGGAGSQAEKKLGGGPEPLDWPALDTLEADALMGVQYPLEQDDIAGAKEAAKGDEFKAAVEAFEKAEVPSRVAPQQKEEIVKQLKALMEAANGDDAAFKEALDKVNAAIRAVRGE
ncbi:MAG TPA: hypothetical protein EYP14_12135 [Planctomycetaceae bacterium]|nr:hypothetical protein [Planctomycetaceae bacterium]